MEARLAAAGLPPLPRTAWLEVDLDALTANLAAIRASLPGGVRVEPVVKADAYGHGAIPVAAALEAAGADGLCVATIDEALALRDAGIELPVLVLYPVPPAFALQAARRRISIAVGDVALLRRLAEAAGTAEPELAVHLEVETGLGRGGVLLEGVVEAARTIADAPGLALAGVWSHLQDPASAVRSADQVRRFDAAVDALRTAGHLPATRHLAASGALVTGDAPPAEAVRPGLIVYGIVPDDLVGVASPLAEAVRPMLSLHARPVRVAELPAGWGISYGPSFTTARPSRIATLPLGYGDGWPRALSDRAGALVRGIRVPLVGRVAMDAVMADVTDVPGSPVSVDAEFVFLGAQGTGRITAHELASARGTIAWEVVTSLSARLPRVYHSAGVVTGLLTLAGRRAEWHASNSGTATSASSRSTQS
ncbi:MAG TPA: alanine racemase [Candidatus Limnocylindrales bacterium]|nr:alanine racemase [Candidatus Limnocylindrales bacterium]